MGLFGRFGKKASAQPAQEADRRGSPAEHEPDGQLMVSEPDSVYMNNTRSGNATLLNSSGSMYRNGSRRLLHAGTAKPAPPASPEQSQRGVMATPRSEGTPYDVSYGHTRVFIGADHGAILDRMQAALLKQGFRILSSIDLQQSLKSSKVSCGDFRRYTIMTACHPKLLYKGVFEEPSLGLLPPSNVVVMEGDFNKSDIVVQITKPSTIYKALHNQSPKLRGILSETDARLKLAMDHAANLQD